MAKYMFLYRSDDEANPDVSPEEMQKSMESWMQWIGGAMAAGWMIKAGDALKPEGRVLHSDKSVTDGPFAEAKEIIGGYSLIEAEDFDQAVKLAEDCPVFMVGGHVEIRELANFDPPEQTS